MKITPITKKYTNPCGAISVNFVNKSSVTQNSKENFYCKKTIVNDTLNEFSNSRGNCLADIDLADIYLSNNNIKVTRKAENKNNNELDVNKTLIKNDSRNIQFLADMPLCDTYELAKNSKKNNNLQIPFNGAYPQYLIDQDAVEQYEDTSNGIQDIANSTYCSFKGFQKTENTIMAKLVGFVKRYLPL